MVRFPLYCPKCKREFLINVIQNKAAKEQLYSVIYKLTEKQFRRIYSRYFLNMKLRDIAELEGISITAVRNCIFLGLRKLKKILKKTL